MLLAKAAAALPPGGLLLVHEKLVEDDGMHPLANALVNLDMMVWTSGRQLGATETQNLFRGRAVEITCGFVAHEQARVCHERTRDGHALLLAPRELIGI